MFEEIWLPSAGFYDTDDSDYLFPPSLLVTGAKQKKKKADKSLGAAGSA